MSCLRARATVAIGTLSLTLVGCIESQRTFVSADTAEADSAELDGAEVDADAPDTDDADDDTTPVDTAVRPDADPDTVATYCDEAGDCALTLGPCEVARCVDHGCVIGYAEAGTVCDNGAGPTPGSCLHGGIIAPDRCEANGGCSDSPAVDANAVPTQWLTGGWFFVLSTMAVPNAGSVTVRGDLTIDASADITLETTGASLNNAIGLADTALGNVCYTDGRDVRLEIGADRVLHGAASEGGDILVAAGLDLRSLLVAVRGTGAPVAVDGLYDFVTTSLEPANTLRTWVGSIRFEEGCQSATGSMVTTSGGGVVTSWSLPVPFDVGAGCFANRADSPVPLQVQLAIAPGTGTSGTLIRWRGAATDDGAFIVMTRDDDAEDPRYGTILLVRRPESSVDPTGESWAEVFQGERGEAEGLIAEHAILAFGASSTITGRAWASNGGEAVDVSGTYDSGAVGLLAMTLAAPAGGSHLRYLARRASRDDLAVFYTIPNGGSVGIDQEPAGPSLGVLLRRAAVATPSE